MTTAHLEPETQPVSRWREAALGLVFLGVGVAVLLLARAIDAPARETAVSSRIWPVVLGIGIVALSLVQVVAALLGRSASETVEPTTRIGVLRVVGSVLAVVVFGFLWYYVHFLASGFLLVAALTWVAGGRGLKDLVLFPAAVTVVLYGLFALLLKVPV